MLTLTFWTKFQFNLFGTFLFGQAVLFGTKNEVSWALWLGLTTDKLQILTVENLSFDWFSLDFRGLFWADFDQVSPTFDRAVMEGFDKTLTAVDFLVRAEFDCCWLSTKLQIWLGCFGQWYWSSIGKSILTLLYSLFAEHLIFIIRRIDQGFSPAWRVSLAWAKFLCSPLLARLLFFIVHVLSIVIVNVNG